MENHSLELSSRSGAQRALGTLIRSEPAAKRKVRGSPLSRLLFGRSDDLVRALAAATPRAVLAHLSPCICGFGTLQRNSLTLAGSCSLPRQSRCPRHSPAPEAHRAPSYYPGSFQSRRAWSRQSHETTRGAACSREYPGTTP